MCARPTKPPGCAWPTLSTRCPAGSEGPGAFPVTKAEAGARPPSPRANAHATFPSEARRLPLKSSFSKKEPPTQPPRGPITAGRGARGPCGVPGVAGDWDAPGLPPGESASLCKQTAGMMSSQDTMPGGPGSFRGQDLAALKARCRWPVSTARRPGAGCLL